MALSQQSCSKSPQLVSLIKTSPRDDVILVLPSSKALLICTSNDPATSKTSSATPSILSRWGWPTSAPLLNVSVDGGVATLMVTRHVSLQEKPGALWQPSAFATSMRQGRFEPDR